VSTFAHGPNPAGVEIIASTDASPFFVKLTKGAAMRYGSLWRFVCQAKWDGPDSPLMARFSQHESLVVAAQGPTLIDANGQITNAANESFNANTVRMLVAMDGELFALAGFSKEAVLWRFDGADNPTVITTPSVIDDLSVQNGQLLVAILENGGLHLQSYDRDGKKQDPSTVISTAIQGVISLRHANGISFVILRDGDEYFLYRIENELVLLMQSDEPIHGPVTHPLGPLITRDRKLARLDGNSVVHFEDETRLACLRNDTGNSTYACVEPDLVQVNKNGSLGEPIFTLSTLNEPDYTGLNEDEEKDCELDWLDLIADTGLTPPPPPPDVPQDNNSGCSPAHGSKSRLPAWIVALGSVFILRRRLASR
jgi:hypothetical protein